MDEEDNTNTRQENDSEEANRPAVDDVDNAAEWLDMSLTGSPLFEMLSRIATGTAELRPQGLDVESISPMSPSPSSSTSSLTTDTSTAESSKENCIIWVEPFMSCRIFDYAPSDGLRSSLPTDRRPPRMRCLRRGGTRVPSHGPTNNENLRCLSSMPRCARSKCGNPGGAGDVRQDPSDPNATSAKDFKLQSLHDYEESMRCIQDVGQLNREQYMESTMSSLAPEETPKSRQTLEECILSHPFHSQQNNNHPSIGDDGQSKEAGDLSYSCHIKHGEDETILEGDGDTRVEGKDNENEIPSTAVHAERRDSRQGLRSPLLVKTVNESTDSTGQQGQNMMKNQKNDDVLSEMQAVSKCAEGPAVARCIGTKADKQLYPFESGTFRSWCPYSIMSDPGGLVKSSKTGWSAHVTREQRFSRGLASRNRIERCLQNGSQSSFNRTRLTTGLSDNPYESLPRLSDTGLQYLEAHQSRDISTSPTSVHETPSEVDKNPKVPSCDSMNLQTSPSRSRDLKRIVTLKEIQNALDIALHSLSQLSGSCFTESDINLDVEHNMSIWDSQGTTEPSVTEGTLSQSNIGASTYRFQPISSTQTSKIMKLFKNAFTDNSQENSAILLSSDKENTEHSLKDTGIDGDSDLCSMPTEANEKDFDKANQPLKTDETNSLTLPLCPTARAECEIFRAHVHGDESEKQMHQEALTSDFEPVQLSPPKIMGALEHKTLKGNLICESELSLPNKKTEVTEESSDTEQSSKSHTDDTFATGSPTVHDGEESRQTVSPVPDNTASGSQEYLTLAADLWRRTLENPITGLKRERGEGDGTSPCLARSQQASDVERITAGSEFEKLDLDIYSNTDTRFTSVLSDTDELKKGPQRTSTERKSRRNETNGVRELLPPVGMGKVTSDSHLTHALCPPSSSRQTRVSDTLLFMTSTPTSHVDDATSSFPTKNEEMVINLNSTGKQQAVRDVNNTTDDRLFNFKKEDGGRGEPLLNDAVAVIRSVDDNVIVNEGSNVDEDLRKSSTQSIRQRFNSFVRMCLRRK